MLADALVHVAVAGHDQRLAAGGDLDLGERAEQVVGLEAGRGLLRPAEAGEELGRLLELPGERVGDRRAVGVVGGVELGAVVRGLGAEAQDDRPRARSAAIRSSALADPSSAFTE